MNLFNKKHDVTNETINNLIEPKIADQNEAFSSAINLNDEHRIAIDGFESYNLAHPIADK